jgi:hypothetical protein
VHQTLALTASAKVKNPQIKLWYAVVSALARASAGKANRWADSLNKEKILNNFFDSHGVPFAGNNARHGVPLSNRIIPAMGWYSYSSIVKPPDKTCTRHKSPWRFRRRVYSEGGSRQRVIV